MKSTSSIDRVGAIRSTVTIDNSLFNIVYLSYLRLISTTVGMCVQPYDSTLSVHSIVFVVRLSRGVPVSSYSGTFMHAFGTFWVSLSISPIGIWRPL